MAQHLRLRTHGDAAEALLGRAEAGVVVARRAAFEQLEVAHAWALLHRRRDGWGPVRTWRHLGATQLPVDEYAAPELAVSLRIHPISAQRLMGDAVDLQARLPLTWAAVSRLEVEVWVARKIATATHDLTDQAAGLVDDQVAPFLASLPTARLLALVEARVVAADQAAADARAEKARTARTLVLGRSIESGTRTVFARLDAADAARFHGTAAAIAHVLAEQQTTAPSTQNTENTENTESAGTGESSDRVEGRVETWDHLLARAVGIMADPTHALHLLTGGETPRPAATRPRTVLYVHTTPAQLTEDKDGSKTTDSTGVARGEDLGPLTRKQLIRLLGHEHITVRPVIDLNHDVAADCYEVPASMTERLHLTRPYDVFPYAPSLSRAMDQDHTQLYVHRSPGREAPPGQTRISNLGKMTRHHHRIKTHAPGWTLHQKDGVFWWTTPHGRTLSVDADGTHPHPPVEVSYYRPTFPIHVELAT